MGHKKILIVDDHSILRKGRAMVIDQEPDIVDAGEAEDVQGRLDMIEALKHDVVIVDISLTRVSGIYLSNTTHL